MKNWRKLMRNLVNLRYSLKITKVLKKIEKAGAFRVFKSFSCPNLQGDTRRSANVITLDTWMKARSEINLMRLNPEVSKGKSAATPTSGLSNICCAPLLESLAAVGCPCPCGPCGPCGPCCGPCGPCLGNMADCNCGKLLPPPCNTPPRCIQYMHGYYYYPYGTWFCGPYHVCTGGVPVCGPVCPGTSCGIAPPNPSLLCKCGPCCGVLGCTGCVPPGGSGTGPMGQSPQAPGLPFPFGSFCVPNSPGAPNQQASQPQFSPGMGPGLPQAFSTCCASPCQTAPQETMRTSFSFGGYGIGTPFGACLVPSTPPDSSQTNQSSPKVASPPPKDSLKPVTPKWVSDHGPCQCAECQANKAINFLNKPKPAISFTEMDAKLAWRGINADLIERGSSRKQAVKQPSIPMQERLNYCEMLKPPRARP